VFGVWEDGRYVGVVIFGGGASPEIGRRFDLARSQVCELTRVALREHTEPVSRIVSQALRQLRQSSPGLQLVVSFADPAHGHHGGIYQAMNWTYLGTSDPSKAYIHRATGKLLHQRVVTRSGVGTQFGRAARVHRRADCDPVILPGKHRYALGLDRATRRQLDALAQPYPAVEGSTVSRPTSGGEGRVRSPATALVSQSGGLSQTLGLERSASLRPPVPLSGWEPSSSGQSTQRARPGDHDVRLSAHVDPP